MDNKNQIHFDSLAALGRYTDETKPLWMADEGMTCRARLDWDLNAGWQGALDLAQRGWVEGAKGLATKLVGFKSPERVAQTKRSVAGGRISMSAYCAGSPRCMIKKTQEADSASKPALRLIVQVSANCDINAEYMSNLGTAIARYVFEQERQGRRCEVIAAMGSDVNGTKLRYTWTVKKLSQPINMPALAFSIGHPAAFRRIGFALIERSTARECYSYGRATTLKLDELPCNTSKAVFITGIEQANTVARTVDDALAYLKRVIEGSK